MCETEPRCEMGGFTRLLHSGQEDDLVNEIPTYIADPLPNSVVEHEWYPVLNRPYAFMQVGVVNEWGGFFVHCVAWGLRVPARVCTDTCLQGHTVVNTNHDLGPPRACSG